jgi:hypothetical protein
VVTPNSATGQNDNQTAGTAAGTADGSTQVTNPPGTTSNDNGSDSTKLVGGGPIVGVASTSKKSGYREFNHKKKYNEWQFIYDPGTDTGFLPMTPNQPPPMSQPRNLNAPNANGQNGNSNSLGTSSGFGNGGLQNNPSAPTTGGSGNPSPPPDQPSNPQEPQ